MTRASDKAASRANILKAARTAFNVLGYEITTLRQVAKNAGLSTGAIFASFPGGKDELYREIYGEKPATVEQGRRALRALREIDRMLTNLQPHIAQLPKPYQELVDTYVDPSIGLCRANLDTCPPIKGTGYIDPPGTPPSPGNSVPAPAPEPSDKGLSGEAEIAPPAPSFTGRGDPEGVGGGLSSSPPDLPHRTFHDYSSRREGP